jgi:trans-aconitate 2-methyltransferase
LSDWRPADYLTFADERTRPARDLLAQVPLERVERAYDLGCGPGNSTALLVNRFPGAAIIGIDNSPAMLEAARKACPGASFAAGDLSDWLPEAEPQLLFSNAAFQWVPNHIAVLERLAGQLTEGGVLAVQMPDNLMEPSHRLMQEAAQEPQRGDAALAREALPEPSAYYARLKPFFRRLDIWHTIYNHPLQGVDGIVSWLMTTGLKPWLDPLEEEERAEYLARYRELLRGAYPEQVDGMVLLRFPRLFLVGVR